MLASQSFRFLVVGFFIAVLDYIVYVSFLWSGFTVDAAKSIAFLTGCFCKHVAYKSWTFEAAVALRLVVLYAVSLSVNVGINQWMLQSFGNMSIGFELSFIIATACSASLNFVCMKFFIFRVLKEQN